VQDVRGRGDSDGVFYPLIHERDDGFDTLEWIVAQPWSDGRVVMSGSSYLALTQFHAAASGHPALKALMPVAAPADPDLGFPVSRGMVISAAVFWMAAVDEHLNQEMNATDICSVLSQRPLIDLDEALGRHLRPWRDAVNHAANSAEYWAPQRYQRRILSSKQPMLHVSGWYDDCLNGALENFSALSRRSDQSAGSQRLLIGPWLHGGIGERHSGEIDFGERAQLDITRLQHEWFDACLREQELESARVRLFVMGRNAWIHENEWPVARTRYVPYYLHSAGKANTRAGNGALSTVLPDREPPDRFQYDPDHPAPYAPGLDWTQIGGPDDCSEIELRSDILVYTGPELEQPLLVCGPLRVTLFASSNARDTDWMAKILDVYPDGRAIRLNDGAVRARFREGHERESFLSPGAIEQYEIDCWATCIELPAGHRLRLEITSSAFGKFDVNLNGGGRIGWETEAVVAQQTVYHDVAHPSHLLLPILDHAGA
jgi:putative CocE/NonD family hydrolase